MIGAGHSDAGNKEMLFSFFIIMLWITELSQWYDFLSLPLTYTYTGQ